MSPIAPALLLALAAPQVDPVSAASSARSAPAAADVGFASIPRSGVASAAQPTLTSTGARFPPSGSPADQQLLKELLQAQAGVAAERSIAIKTTQRLGAAGLDARLAALQGAQAPRPEEAKRTATTRARLQGAWGKVSGVMTAKWLVDPRLGCRQQGIDLEAIMGSTGAPAKLDAARSKARACLDRQLLVLRPLEQANGELQAAIAEATAALASAPPAAAGSGPGSAPPRPADGKAN
jgi:hypothetical protein